ALPPRASLSRRAAEELSLRRLELLRVRPGAGLEAAGELPLAQRRAHELGRDPYRAADHRVSAPSLAGHAADRALRRFLYARGAAAGGDVGLLPRIESACPRRAR